MTTNTHWEDLGTRAAALTWFNDAAAEAMRDVRASGNSQAIDVGTRLAQAIAALSDASSAEDVAARVADYERAVALLTQQRWRKAAPPLTAAVPIFTSTDAVEYQDPADWPAQLAIAQRVLPATDPMRNAMEDWASEHLHGYHPDSGVLAQLAAHSDDLQETWRQRMGRLLAFAARYLQGYAQANQAVNTARGIPQAGVNLPTGAAPAPASSGGGKALLFVLGALGAMYLLSDD